MLQVTADLLPAGLVLVDNRERIVFVNTVAAEWSGATATEWIGREVDELLQLPHVDGVEGFFPTFRISCDRMDRVIPSLLREASRMRPTGASCRCLMPRSSASFDVVCSTDTP